MGDNFPKALATVLHHEGGWADHPKDPGGATMKGVTLATYSKFLGRDATKEELRNISDAELQQIYRGLYWDRISGDGLPSGLDLVVFDMAVNAGPGRAAKILQEVLGVTVDRAIGPKTLTMAKTRPASELIREFSDAREEFYKRLPIYATFGKGWLRRVDEVETEAYKLVHTGVRS